MFSAQFSPLLLHLFTNEAKDNREYLVIARVHFKGLQENLSDAKYEK